MLHISELFLTSPVNQLLVDEIHNTRSEMKRKSQLYRLLGISPLKCCYVMETHHSYNNENWLKTHKTTQSTPALQISTTGEQPRSYPEWKTESQTLLLLMNCTINVILNMIFFLQYLQLNFVITQKIYHKENLNSPFRFYRFLNKYHTWAIPVTK